MSAGDIDDRLGAEGTLDELRRASPELNAYLSRGDVAISREFQVPFGAGISDDGNTVYIDSRLNTDYGHGVDLSEPLSVHERVEWALRTFDHIGDDYSEDPRGHRLANRAEYEAVESIFGAEGEEVWKRYDDFIDPQLKAIQREELTSAPSDLAMYPYEGTEWEDKIREAQQ